jgi:type I restriction enzyme M protein
MDNKQYNALFSFIWNIANDVLAHAFEKGDYKKIILPFMVLRRIDVLLEPTKAAVLQKTEFVQTYFANQDFQNFVNARVFQAAVSRLSGQRI